MRLVLCGMSAAEANRCASTEGSQLRLSIRGSNDVYVYSSSGIHSMALIIVSCGREGVVLGSRIGVAALEWSYSHIYKWQGQRVGNQGYIRPVGAD